MNLSVLLSPSIYWHLPVMIVAISLVYSATRFDQWSYIFHETFRWARNMLLFLLGVVVIPLYILARWI